MAVQAKICGITTPDALDAAVRGGAAMVGLNFFPPSPRSVTPEKAKSLSERLDGETVSVGLFVDPDDATLATTLEVVPLAIIQLHGEEPPERVAEVRARFDRPVMKVIKIATEADLVTIDGYSDVADRLLFDTKPPKTMPNALPGGNAISFDWTMLAGRSWPLPWMLAGGLDLDNVAEAVRISGAPAVDLSSGVESSPGVKDPAKITRFLELVATL